MGLKSVVFCVQTSYNVIYVGQTGYRVSCEMWVTPSRCTPHGQTPLLILYSAIQMDSEVYLHNTQKESDNDFITKTKLVPLDGKFEIPASNFKREVARECLNAGPQRDLVHGVLRKQHLNVINRMLQFTSPSILPAN
ncbi:hypothetical protein CRM22_002673 [Opisthorchis felineus]|uniref:Uncharacterized protein n=1 Tax=Opisthorchis felineus TaxID=147828 RepID=A0A4S2M9G1_OPIFE|nr:hypothetical protein CRM22_002673 [Opisthorchis felineus]